MFSTSTMPQTEPRPATWGKIYKTETKMRGHQYFVYFRKDGKDFAYPLSTKSKINRKKLSNLNGKYAQIYGTSSFEKMDLERSQHILTFQVHDAQELQLSDLNKDMSKYMYRNNLVPHLERLQDPFRKQGNIMISDEAANTAIFWGGAALAAEVLRTVFFN